MHRLLDVAYRVGETERRLVITVEQPEHDTLRRLGADAGQALELVEHPRYAGRLPHHIKPGMLSPPVTEDIRESAIS